MYLNRWKVLACTLTVGVGGLAVFATDPAPKPEPTKEPAPLPNLTVKPTSPANGADTPAPVVPAKGEEFEITVPVPPAPAKADDPARKPVADGPVFVPVDAPPAPILPVKGEAEPKDDKKPEPPKKDDVPAITIPPVPANPEAKEAPKPPVLVIPVPDANDKSKPEAPKSPADTMPPSVKVPAADLTPPPPLKSDPPPGIKPPVPPITVPTPETKPDATPLMPPAVPVEPLKAPESVKVPLDSASPKAAETKLKMLLRMGDGQPRFEIRNTVTTELLLKVWGEKIEMQAPPDARSTLAGVTAVGRVRFTAPGIEGTCDHLTILSATGEVLLKGNIHLKAKYGKTWSEMTAEKMVYQIGTAGLTAPGTAKVTPAAYLPE